jgi:hypothetical protein
MILVLRIEKSAILGGLIYVECPYSGLFQTLHKGQSQHHYFLLNDTFAHKYCQLTVALSILRREYGSFGKQRSAPAFQLWVSC